MQSGFEGKDRYFKKNLRMKGDLKSKIITESIWLFALLLISAAVEYGVIVLFDLHPVLNVKIQGLIGLLVIGYGIRMLSRLWHSYNKKEADQNNEDEREVGITPGHD